VRLSLFNITFNVACVYCFFPYFTLSTTIVVNNLEKVLGISAFSSVLLSDGGATPFTPASINYILKRWTQHEGAVKMYFLKNSLLEKHKFYIDFLIYFILYGVNIRNDVPGRYYTVILN
jgi:hypothetical protein